MSEPIGSRLKHAWNAFRARDETNENPNYTYQNVGMYSSFNPTRTRMSISNERSLINSVYTRIAMDAAAYDIEHVRVDEDGNYVETINSSLNSCFSIEANKDQIGRAFIQDAVMSMFDEGCVALVPVDTTVSPLSTGGYEINSLRTGKVVEWYPDHVRVELYNDRTGFKERILLPKSMVGIVENPLYSVMNEPNSTVKRLTHKLNLLDAIDEQSSSGKLDLIIKLPYSVRTESLQKRAEGRKRNLENQLKDSKYGVAYIDGTESVTQLNRPVENNLLNQITYLSGMMFNQLGITEDVFYGKADQAAMQNYYNRTVEPVVTVIIEEARRKFLTKTARSQGQTIMGFRDAFRLIPANELADVADTFTRNEIVTSNEFRSKIGMKPSKAPNANELRNKNMPLPEAPVSEDLDVSAENQNGGIPVEEVQAMLSEMAAEYDAAMKEALDGVQNDINSVLGGEEDAG